MRFALQRHTLKERTPHSDLGQRITCEAEKEISFFSKPEGQNMQFLWDFVGQFKNNPYLCSPIMPLWQYCGEKTIT